MIDKIWTDYLYEENDALRLLCIMDQIQDYAVAKHREFVIRHRKA